MPENGIIISQFRKNGITYIAFDDGYTGVESENAMVYRIINAHVENVDLESVSATKIDSKDIYYEIPFLFFCKEMNTPMVAKGIDEIEDFLNNYTIKRVVYFGDYGFMRECIIESSEYKNKEIILFKIPETNKEFIVLTETSVVEKVDDEVIVESGTNYEKTEIPEELYLKTEAIGVPIKEGKTFELENNRLKETICSMKDKIEQIESKEGFTKKYAVVHGGDDGTEAIQLQSAKTKSAKDYEVINKLYNLMPQPYRFRVDIKENGEIQTYYFGPVHCSEISPKYEVLSEFSPLGKELVTYNSSNHKINNIIQLRREFSISNSALKHYTNIIGTAGEDSGEFRDGLTDPFLISVFKMRRNDHQIKDIVLTIQENQNKIVDANENSNIVVQGCAGSGKTMVMMHRLSRLQNWVKAFDPREVVIITPNDQYRMYMKAVTEGLAISNITQTTVENYYNDLLNEFDRDFSYKGNIISENKIRTEFLEFIYSKEFISKFYSAYDRVMQERETLISKLLDGYKLLAMKNPSKRLVANKDFQLYCRELLEPLVQEINAPEIELKKKEETLDYLNGRIEDLKMNGKKSLEDEYHDVILEAWEAARVKLMKIMPESVKKDAIERLLKEDFELASDTDILLFLFKAQRILQSVEEEIQKCEEAEEKFQDVNNVISEIESRKDRVSLEIDSLKQMLFSDTIKQEIKSLEQQVKMASDIGTYRHIFEITTKELLHTLKMRMPRGVHKYDLYARLLFCRKYFSTKVDLHNYICIDEGQDISLCEYQLLYDLSNKKSIFNIYGDLSQALRPEICINKWEDLQKIWGLQEYYILNENYRNSNEITEFCNTEFNMNMRKIGINCSAVRDISKEEFIKEINSSKNLRNERWAILIPRMLNKDKIIKLFQNATLSTDKLGKNIISIMYVDEVKGFEFERVYVLPEKMNENVKYVSYTRALNDLIVVSI